MKESSPQFQKIADKAHSSHVIIAPQHYYADGEMGFNPFYGFIARGEKGRDLKTGKEWSAPYTLTPDGVFVRWHEPYFDEKGTLELSGWLITPGVEARYSPNGKSFEHAVFMQRRSNERYGAVMCRRHLYMFGSMEKAKRWAQFVEVSLKEVGQNPDSPSDRRTLYRVMEKSAPYLEAVFMPPRDFSVPVKSHPFVDKSGNVMGYFETSRFGYQQFRQSGEDTGKKIITP